MPWLVTRIDSDTTSEVDRLIAEGAVASRSDAARRGLELLLDEHRRRAVGEAIVDGYRRIPQTDDDGLWSEEASVRMITEEPW
ncbi:MAG TPA: hypothetical protein VGC11_02000 [Acidimicrobiia bacterium]|jgi:Arc/MetJ-type ribon-helix-helix transcriptional regulator